MRVLFDCQAVLQKSGGMRLFAEELLAGWAALGADDEITVLAPRWLRIPSAVRRGPFRLSNDSALVRAVLQSVITPAVFRLGRFDVLLSANSILSPLMEPARSVLVAHDWRHLRRPEEFSRAQRWFRRWWSWSAARAGTVVAISSKTKTDTQCFLADRDVVTIENGWDHAARWGELPADPEALVRFAGGYLLTFGHHTNKRPELAVEALGRLDEPLGLVVLGASSEYRERLEALAAAAGVEGRVLLPGFVEDVRYRALVVHARAILLLSSDEGFGLPMAEALLLGVPAIATSDSGVGEVFAGLVRLAEPDAASVADQVRWTLERPNPPLRHPRRWADAALEYSGLLHRLVDAVRGDEMRTGPAG